MNTLTETGNAEYRRIKRLSELDLDYGDLQKEFGHLIFLAAGVAGAETSLINLIDNYTQWTVVSPGGKLGQVPREETVCTHTIENSGPLEIPRLDEDPRFKDKAFVTAENGIKYYLGIPLTLPTGENIGALCVLDRNEKKLSKEKIDQLKVIAKVVVDQLILKYEAASARMHIDEAMQLRKKVAHDIRSPLSGIIGIAELAVSIDLKQDEYRSYLEMIEKSGRQLLDMTTEILQQKKKEASSFSDPITLTGLGEKIFSLYKPQAENKNITLKLDIDPEDKNRTVSKRNLLQIIGNLMANAIKFTPEEGRIKLSLSVHSGKDTNSLQIEVEDTGSGLTREKITEIMKGQATSTPGSIGEKGYGLGLKLLKSIVEEMRGSLEIERLKNSGSRFTVLIPQA